MGGAPAEKMKIQVVQYNNIIKGGGGAAEEEGVGWSCRGCSRGAGGADAGGVARCKCRGVRTTLRLVFIIRCNHQIGQ